ncbi:zinc finger protein 638 isoform X4 [Emydura macquarii macquarii]|uniref:zinc finger protein 638 isoform X4 n=1 Tax=Emydura macquarii macquarii TaxID=1129001 RepID=UPI00352B7D1D
MFSPRGNLPQRPRAPNPSGSKPQGAFRGGGGAGLQRKPAPGTSQGISQRFVGQETLQRTGSRRTNVQVTQHRTDPRQAKEMANLREEQKEKVRATRWDNNPRPTGNTSRKQPASTRITEQNSNVQSRYTTESASSILASFGLSNEDLEELSRYPDDQLTPENMPLILRDIRMRKMGHQLPNLHSQSRGKETIGGTGGSTVKGKVIDYGHTSRYGYTEDPLEVRVYNSEEPAEENRKEFQSQQSISVPQSNVTCNPMFQVEELIKQMGFHSDTSNTQSFFPVDGAGKVSGLCITPTGLPMVKPMSQPVMPPMMPPMSQPVMPPMMPPMSQPVMPPMMPPPMPPMPQSVMTPIVQQSLGQPPMGQPVMPPITHPPFSAELLAAVRQHERIQHESGTNQSNAQIGSVAGQKNFQTQAEAPIKSPFGIVKASWLPVFSQAAAQKIKRLPTPSMMNDYYATSPRIFPHMCSLCNVECTHMKDWIQHQNNPAHIESCRQLRQQYPDWNPESHSSKRNAGDRKENQTPKRRSNSASPPGPRHSRGSGSGHTVRRSRSRSRSRSPGRFRLARPRSRSPRPMRRPSPRHRSRSPQRSRNPLRSSPRPQRSASNEWASRRTTRSPDKKAALEAVVKSLGASFVAEFNKQKSLQAAGQGSSGIGKASPTRGISGVGKIPGTMKKPISATGHQKTLKKDLSSVPGSAASKMKFPGPANLQEKKGMDFDGKGISAKETNVPRPAPYNRLLREKLLSCGTVLHISDLPDDGFSDQDIKKIVQPFGKVSDLLVLRSRNEAFLEMNYKEAVIAAVKYGETVPVLVNGKRVKISIAEKPKAPPGQVKVSVKKTTLNVKKPALGTKKDGNGTTTTKKTKSATPAASAAKLTKAGQTTTKAVKPDGKHEVTKKPAVQVDIKTKKTSATSAKPNEKKRIDPKKSAESKKKDVKTKKVAEPKRAAETMTTTEPKKAGEARNTTEPKKAGEDEAKEISRPVAVQEKIILTPTVEVESNQSEAAIVNKENLDAKSTVDMKTAESTKKENVSKTTAETTKSEEPTEPASKELADICVVLVSNLPDKGYSVEEVSNLTKPFGGLKDVLILSSHKKAYLEINKKSADSMVKFYTCFPMSVDGNQLSISMVPEYKNIKDEEAIFTAIIKEANSKVNEETLYNQFVHLGNLPDDGYTELEVVCVGLRFGKVDHYVVLKNKKKAILQLDSPDSAKSMSCFLKQYPYNMGENTLTCMLSPRREPPEAEVMKKEMKNQEPSKGISDLKKNPEGSGVVQTAAANPPVEPSVAKEEIISNSVKAETSTVQIEASEMELERTVPAGRISRNSKTGSSSNVKPKEEEELFPFNLDEFVTVDEVVEETDSPIPTRRNPPRGKRKDTAKNNSSSEPLSKRKKGKSSIAHVAESELSFVTLDEIGEEEEMTAQLIGDSNLEAVTDPQSLVTVDEVNEEELISEAVKDPQSLVTLDEISEPEDLSSHDAPKDVSTSVYEEQDLLKAEPLVTVDEIGEVEELPLNEPSDLNIEENLKPKEEDDKRALEDPGGFLSSQLPEDPSTLVTVDEIQEDSDDQPLVTLDEVTEDDEDFLADFNRLKEELNFVTVDEVGEEDEEEENTFVCTALEEEDIVAIAGPEEMEILADVGPEEEDIIANSESEEKETLEAGTEEIDSGTLIADTREVDGEAIAANTEEAEEAEILNKTSEKEIKEETESEQQSTELTLSKAHESNEMETQTKNKQQPPVKTPGKRGRPRKRPIVPPPEKPVETEQEKCEKYSKEETDKTELVEGSTSDSNKEKIRKGILTTPESNISSEDSQTATVKEPDTESVLPDLNPGLLPDADVKEEDCSETLPQSSEKNVKDEFGSGDTEPESKRKKVDSSADKSKTPSTPKGLDFLVPKAGYFCQICSLFYADEMSMKNHCKTLRHQQNMEKFMAKQKDEEDEGEELSSR